MSLGLAGGFPPPPPPLPRRRLPLAARASRSKFCSTRSCSAKLDYGALDPRDLAGITSAENKLRALREAYANTSFSIFQALVTVVLLVGTKLSPQPWKVVASAGAIAGCLMFLLTLLMILSRAQVLFRSEVRTKNPPTREAPAVTRIVGPPGG